MHSPIIAVAHRTGIHAPVGELGRDSAQVSAQALAPDACNRMAAPLFVDGRTRTRTHMAYACASMHVMICVGSTKMARSTHQVHSSGPLIRSTHGQSQVHPVEYRVAAPTDFTEGKLRPSNAQHAEAYRMNAPAGRVTIVLAGHAAQAGRRAGGGKSNMCMKGCRCCRPACCRQAHACGAVLAVAASQAVHAFPFHVCKYADAPTEHQCTHAHDMCVAQTPTAKYRNGPVGRYGQARPHGQGCLVYRLCRYLPCMHACAPVPTPAHWGGRPAARG